MPILLPGHQFNLFWLVWGQGDKLGQGHLKVKVIPRSDCKCLTFYQQATERHSFFHGVFWVLTDVHSASLLFWGLWGLSGLWGLQKQRCWEIIHFKKYTLLFQPFYYWILQCIIDTDICHMCHTDRVFTIVCVNIMIVSLSLSLILSQNLKSYKLKFF